MTAGPFATAEHARATLRNNNISLRPTVAQTWEKSTHVIIVWSLFFSVMTVAWLMGRIAMDRLELAAEGAGVNIADIVYVMRDGIHCRYILFDNETAQLADHGVEACPPEVEVYSH